MTNLPDRNRDMERIRALTDDERRWFLMWLSGFKSAEFGAWLDQWQDRQSPVDPAPAAAEGDAS